MFKNMKQRAWVGRIRENIEEEVVKCRWKSLQKSTIRMVGVIFSYNKQLAEKENFCKLITD